VGDSNLDGIHPRIKLLELVRCLVYEIDQACAHAEQHVKVYKWQVRGKNETLDHIHVVSLLPIKENFVVPLEAQEHHERETSCHAKKQVSTVHVQHVDMVLAPEVTSTLELLISVVSRHCAKETMLNYVRFADQSFDRGALESRSLLPVPY
jgi:hypothetical protein